MAENKTKPTTVSVDAYIAAIASEEQRSDCKTLIALMRKVTGKKPQMWGPTIVGFDTYHYVYESGREGDAPQVGFAPRGREIVIYLMTDTPSQQALLARLGKHRTGKVCLYIRRLAELDTKILERLVVESVREIRERYP